MIKPNTKRKMTCFWCGRKYIDLIKHTDKQHEGLIPRSYDIHKPDKKIESSKLSYSTSCLGEKQLMVCKTCRKLSFDLKEKETADMLIEYVVEMDKKLKEALIKELRSKNPFKTTSNPDLMGILVDRHYGYNVAVDELEKMLKEERK